MLVTYVALLRGINVGGKNKLPMRDLLKLCTEVGCTDVRSYIQSGNVIFQTEAVRAEELAKAVAGQIAEQFGYRIPVVLRTAEQLQEVLHSNPFLENGASEDTLHVMFLKDLLTPEQVAGLDPKRSAPDAFAVRGQEIYLHLPHGAADTKLTNAYFDAKLSTISTSRNWRTVTKLLALMQVVT